MSVDIKKPKLFPSPLSQDNVHQLVDDIFACAEPKEKDEVLSLFGKGCGLVAFNMSKSEDISTLHRRKEWLHIGEELKSEVCSSTLSVLSKVESMGELELWEYVVLTNMLSDIGTACLQIGLDSKPAKRQRAEKWFLLGGSLNNEMCTKLLPLIGEQEIEWEEGELRQVSDIYSTSHPLSDRTLYYNLAFNEEMESVERCKYLLQQGAARGDMESIAMVEILSALSNMKEMEMWEVRFIADAVKLSWRDEPLSICEDIILKQKSRQKAKKWLEMGSQLGGMKFKTSLRVLSDFPHLNDIEAIGTLHKYGLCVGGACIEIASRQNTLSDVSRWLHIGATSGRSGCSSAAFFEGAVLFMTAMSNYKRNEGVFLASSSSIERDMACKDEEQAIPLFRRGNHDYIDKSVLGAYGSHQKKFLVETLLCGSLYKNQSCSLYRSFFGSTTREVHLLPLIASYVLGEVKDMEMKKVEELHCRTGLYLYLYFLYPLFFSDLSSLRVLHISKSPASLFLPILLPHLVGLESLELSLHHYPDSEAFPLSLVNTSRLKELHLLDVSMSHLSSMSRYDLSSLKIFKVQGAPSSPIPFIKEWKNLHLETLSLSYCNINDISWLKEIEHIIKDSDSPPTLGLYYNNISDLSPLDEMDFPFTIDIRENPIAKRLSRIHGRSVCRGEVTMILREDY